MVIASLSHSHLSEKQKATVERALQNLDMAFSLFNASPPRYRHKCGRTGQNELFPQKIPDFAQVSPSLIRFDIDCNEFLSDPKNRKFLKTLAN